MRKATLILLTMVLIGCNQQELPQGSPLDDGDGVVAESPSPVIEKGSTLAESIGLETLGGVFTPLIAAGTAVPCRQTMTFSTAEDNQDQITITLYRGNAPMAKDNEKIGEFQIQELPAVPRGTPQIEVSFIVTETDVVLEAEDLVSGQPMKVEKIEDDSRSVP